MRLFFQGQVGNSLVEVYPKSSIKPPGGLFISNAIEGELKRDGGAYLIYIAKTMVSVLHKNYHTKWKSSSSRSWRSCSQGSKTNLSFQLVNKPSWISPHEVL